VEARSPSQGHENLISATQLLKKLTAFSYLQQKESGTPLVGQESLSFLMLPMLLMLPRLRGEEAQTQLSPPSIEPV